MPERRHRRLHRSGIFSKRKIFSKPVYHLVRMPGNEEWDGKAERIKYTNTLDRRVMPALSYSGKRTAIKSITKTQGKTGSLISQLIRCLSFLFLTSKRISSAVHRKSMLFLMWIGNCICAKVLNAGITAL